MTITLPDGMGKRVEALARRHGFSSPTDYLVRLVENAEADADFVDPAGPPELTPRNRAELERMLDEGMASGDIVEADDAFWAERRRVLLEKIARKKGTAP